MTIHFQLTGDHVRQLNQEKEAFVARRCGDPDISRYYWRRFLPATLAALAVVGKSLPFAIFAVALMWAVNHLSGRWYRSRYAKNYYSAENLSSSLLPFQLELLPDRLILSNAALSHHHFWPSFLFLRETKNYFYLHFHPLSGLTVPKFAFTSEADVETFRQAVRAHQPAKPERKIDN